MDTKNEEEFQDFADLRLFVGLCAVLLHAMAAQRCQGKCVRDYLRNSAVTGGSFLATDYS